MNNRAVITCLGVVAIATAGFLSMSIQVSAAEVSLSIRPVDVANTFEGELQLNSRGEAVSGIQLDLLYNPDLLRLEIHATGALAEQQKSLAIAEPAPGALRILIIGENSHAMLDAAFAKLLITRLQVTEESPSVRLANAVATSPEGQAIEVTVKPVITA